MRKWLLAGLGVIAILSAPLSWAGDTKIVDAKATKSGATWRFDVTLRHDDTGWDHYADAWRVVAPDGTVLGTRTLYHPHVDEQPFTRSLAGVAVPAGLSEVKIEARDNVHGWAGETFSVKLE